ncbi:olfactory receptor 2D2-like [Sphaerodactylus townsendi]|uniref:olfactory receptor 2D2-like n=1 Tax=Sphaerodactylus townsendi TaxID=933632 RepID=UPI0020271379|nr:olfactory receptor 2D2-like [Sphaerodactylus townsendi]
MKLSALDVQEWQGKVQREEATVVVENVTLITEFIFVGLSNDRKTRIVLFVVILLTYTLTIMGNLAVITLVRSDSHLQTPMYYFLMHLSCLEICYVTCTEPQMLAHLLAGKGAISFTRCMVQILAAMLMGAAECSLLAVMAYDRYLAICQPLLYPVAMGRWQQMLLASSCWAIGLFFGTVFVGCALRHSYCGPNRMNHFMCELPVVLQLACDDTHTTEVVVFALSALGILIPISIILISYAVILFSVLQIRSATGWHKAFSTCASHLVVVTLFYGTLVSMYLIPRSAASSDRGKHISVFYVVVTPLLNPVIYTLRNKDIHQAVGRVLRRGGVVTHSTWGHFIRLTISPTAGSPLFKSHAGSWAPHISKRHCTAGRGRWGFTSLPLLALALRE